MNIVFKQVDNTSQYFVLAKEQPDGLPFLTAVAVCEHLFAATIHAPFTSTDWFRLDELEEFIPIAQLHSVNLFFKT